MASTWPSLRVEISLNSRDLARAVSPQIARRTALVLGHIARSSWDGKLTKDELHDATSSLEPALSWQHCGNARRFHAPLSTGLLNQRSG